MMIALCDSAILLDTDFAKSFKPAKLLANSPVISPRTIYIITMIFCSFDLQPFPGFTQIYFT
jgi:hypothetical protein